MSSESELRDALNSSAKIPTTGIDAEAVVRKVRARRVPKQVAFSSLSVLAIAGVATLGIVTLPSLQSGQDAASTAGMMASAPESSQGDVAGGGSQKSLDTLLIDGNLCGMPTLGQQQTNEGANNPAPDNAGLALSLSFPASAPAHSAEVIGTVTLTNSGTTSASGTTGPIPVITVSRGGVTVWHTHGPSIMQVTPIVLEPGQSHTYAAAFTPVECGPEDEPDQFRDHLPALTAGTYEMSAQLLFISDSAEPGESILVSGPASSIELR